MNMNMNMLRRRSLLFFVGLSAFLLASLAPNAFAAAPGSVTMTVTAVGKKDSEPPTIKGEDVQLYVNKDRAQVANWQRGEKLYLEVLIDDSLDPDVAAQWSDLKEFFKEQPSTTYISVSYARNGTAVVAQDFTNDHELAAKALRLPIGAGAFSSPYLTLLELMKRLPAGPAERRSIVMISSGIDYFHGNFPESPDVESTYEHAQKENINIWSIYYPDAGHLGRRGFRAFRGQSDLSRLAEATGGESFYLGVNEAVTFKPFLDELATHLRNQYLLTFHGSGGAKGRFARVKLATELPNVQFLQASDAFLPPAK
jgi:VWFA-related protein